ncbi:MAG: LamG domain-containing protein [Bacteroidetes bacterium]|nr:LamG domain-containing protein [Bacteroidota bacterium]
MDRFYIPVVALILLLLLPTCKDDENDPGYPTDGLVSYLAFENNLADAMGNMPPGVINGGISYVEGQIGKAIALNGTDQHVSFTRETFHQGNQVSASVWFRTSAIGPFKVFIVCNDFGFVTLGDGISYSISHPITASATWTFTGDRWTHVVGTYDGEDITIYVDGQWKETNNHPGILLDNNFNLVIGFFSGDWWAGNVDELHIYNRVLQQADVMQLYERGL